MNSESLFLAVSKNRVDPTQIIIMARKSEKIKLSRRQITLKIVFIMIPKLLVTEKRIWSPKPRATILRKDPMIKQMNPMIQVGVKKTDLV